MSELIPENVKFTLSQLKELEKIDKIREKVLKIRNLIE